MESNAAPTVYLVSQNKVEIDAFKPILHLCTGASEQQCFESIADIRPLPAHKTAVIVLFIESQRQVVNLPTWCQAKKVRCLQVCRFDTKHNYMLSALSQGFNGVVEYKADPDLLLKALKTLLKGESWFPRKVIEDALFYYMSAGVSNRLTLQNTAEEFELSNREQEVLELILCGKNNSAIATTLHLSIHTVKCHVRNIFRKIGVQSRAEIIGALNRSKSSSAL